MRDCTSVKFTYYTAEIIGNDNKLAGKLQETVKNKKQCCITLTKSTSSYVKV